MTQYNNDSFNYTSNSILSDKTSKIELFMQKVQIAKDISKLKTLKNTLLPHCSKLFKKQTSENNHLLYKNI